MIFVKKKYNKQKAQIGAPFELLVAIIIMGFVILAGTYALKNLQQSTCLGDKKEELSNFNSSLRDVVLGSDLVIRNISLDTKACFNQRYEYVRLNAYDDKGKCGTYCGGGDSCLLLEYTYEDKDTFDYKYPIEPICTHLPTTINFATTPDECLSEDEISEDLWQVWNPKDSSDGSPIGLPPGKYRMFKKTNTNSSNIQICLLRKK
ncbi:MAG: hypothetical protein PHR26_02205 [Candidatus ainarchaeum sp.]|nr:hypothetical protein [Candidatus ainarchaeum sp.]MDD3976201.1 hypothetical protein [Candidatus ainarchaeum sp.]